jgi:endonuclease III
MKPSNISPLVQRLRQRYKDFSHYNRENPLDEYVFILLSVTTAEPVYLRTFKALKSTYPSYAKLLSAPTRAIAKVIHEGGQSTLKASALKATLHILKDHFGRPTLTPLKRMTTIDCESFLLSLPGIGKKVARCIMMYSLNRRVFPVDTHCWRVSCRLGLVDPNKHGRERGAEVLQTMIPPQYRFSLHVNMVSLGREFCKAIKPICSQCPLVSLCPTGRKRRSVSYAKCEI